MAANYYKLLSYFDDFTFKHYQNTHEIESASGNLSMESDRQVKQWNQTEVLAATRTLKQK